MLSRTGGVCPLNPSDLSAGLINLSVYKRSVNMTNEEEIELILTKVDQLKTQILSSSKSLKAGKMESRYGQMMFSPILVMMMLNKVQVEAKGDGKNIDIGFSVSTPKGIIESIERCGPELAAIFSDGPASPERDLMTEIAAIILICSRMLSDVIASDLCTFEDRLHIGAAASELVSESLLSMLRLSLPQGQESSSSIFLA
jgi:hypothetical protein